MSADIAVQHARLRYWLRAMPHLCAILLAQQRPAQHRQAGGVCVCVQVRQHQQLP